MRRLRSQQRRVYCASTKSNLTRALRRVKCSLGCAVSTKTGERDASITPATSPSSTRRACNQRFAWRSCSASGPGLSQVPSGCASWSAKGCAVYPDGFLPIAALLCNPDSTSNPCTEPSPRRCTVCGAASSSIAASVECWACAACGVCPRYDAESPGGLRLP